MSTGKNVKTPGIPTKHDSNSNTKGLKSSSDKNNQDGKFQKDPCQLSFAMQQKLGQKLYRRT